MFKAIFGFVLIATCYVSQTALASPSCAASGTVTEETLLQCVNGLDAFQHLEALQKIAESQGGTRAAGTLGYELSANYVAQQLLAAGYQVQLFPFDFVKFKKTAPAHMELTSPNKIIYEDEKAFKVMTFSPSGKVVAPLLVIDPALGPDNKSSSGCEAEDFKDFVKGSIALIQRGTCPFSQKVKNAQDAGAAGVVIFNQGDQESRKDVFVGTLTADIPFTIPVLATSYQIGVDLIGLSQPTLFMEVSTSTEKKVSFNVIADSQHGNPDNIVFIGSHLDSVDEGPGSNDNGSGSASILEVALKMKNVKTNNRLRFAWWGAEELGLVGSTKYVQSLSEVEKSKIALYLNFDMVASPNYIFGVYDGDGSQFKAPGPQGSGAIEQLFHMFYGLHGPMSVEVPLNGRSDYAAFAAAGIPVGGIFTGAEGAKTEAEAQRFGGEVGKAYDHCYHQACDNLENINRVALETNVDAIAFTALTYGYSTASVTGQLSFEKQSLHSTLRSERAPQIQKSITVPIDCVGVAYLE